MGLQSFPVGSLDIASLFWGKMARLHGLVRAELEKGLFSSQRPCGQGEISKGYTEEVRQRNIGQGDSADLGIPETCPSCSFLLTCRWRKVLGNDLKNSRNRMLGENSFYMKHPAPA